MINHSQRLSLLPLDNGQNWSVVDTEYDSLGRVKRRSEPYQNSGIARYWSTFDYDILGRVLKVTLPDDSPSERSVGYTRYLGFITETENAKGQVKRETRNALGEVIEVIDGYHSSGDERSTSTYEYDAQGNLVKMMNNGANPTSIIYDKLGRKKSMNDPDKGRWSYRYNAFGELVEQTDAKLQKSRMHYDTLGRMIERVDRLRDGAIEQSTEWVYDRAVNGIGQLASVRMVDGTDNEKTFDSYRYDTLGRLVSSTRTLEGSYSYTSTQTYNSIGQLYQQFDGSNNQRDNGYRGVQYGYDAGVQVVVEDVRRTDSGQPFRVYDQILDVDARGNVVSSQHGMVFTTRIYDPATGRLTKVKSNKGSTLGSELQNLSYDWDTLGNLSSRHDQSGTKNLYERYDYDALNRLKVSNSSVNGQHYQQSVSYNAQGNIISKSDVESGASYQYGGQKTGCARTAGPHAVTQIGDTVYCYDENGNNISGDGRVLEYSTFTRDSCRSPCGSSLRCSDVQNWLLPFCDKVTSIITDDASIRFTYDHNRSRYRRDDTIKGKQSTTWYLGNVEVIESVTDANETKLEYRRSVGSAVESTIYINGEYQQERTSYLLSDHLGSIDLITDVNGSIIEHQSFDAWGMRRNALDAAMLVAQNQGNFDFATDFSSVITKRGFTGHEMLDAVGIIHMNGRIYDPKLGRFLQADPHIQEPFMTQSLNRYSYVINNPLNATDPTGYFFDKIADIVVAVIAVAASIITGNPLAGWQIWSTYNATVRPVLQVLAQIYGIVNAAVHGDFGALFGPEGIVASAAIRGGDIGNAFLRAGLTYVAGQIGDTGHIITDIVVQAAVHGTISEATGGKFKNGAAVGAFYAAHRGLDKYAAEGEMRYKQRNAAREYAQNAPAIVEGLVCNDCYVPGAVSTDTPTGEFGTSNFVSKYVLNDNLGIDLSDVGLDDEFENNVQVQLIVDTAHKELVINLRNGGDGAILGKGGFGNIGGRNPFNSLFSLGSGQISYTSNCNAGNCVINFNYLDSFGDPFDFSHGPLGIPIDFGSPYHITHSFRRRFKVD